MAHKTFPERTTAEMLWAALHHTPGGTSAKLAEIAGIGGSTARKLLVALERTGGAYRTEGESDGSARRPADRWWPKTTSSDIDGESETLAEETAEVPAESADTATPAQDPATPTTGEDDATAGENEADTADAGIDSAGTDLDDATDTSAEPVTEADDAIEMATDEPDTDAEAATDEADADAGPATVETEATPDAEESAKPKRLGKGALRGMIEDFLTDCKGREFTPSQLAKELDRSAGAIHNALEKLVAEGTAIRTCEAPKRYTLATEE
ncbi:hypothetical protein NONI108955_01445 [Nocardia ninae]|uniref:HTH iclR-type domain-containing protein n=1 Tax=Nocardia ninae NBRC 108245 TaxID=1210091 RepID=A0A511MC48_9NOCA|nr:hypothetical protein [Nocardia ninae]GEM38245.1 hypothetical protein NN4_27640 [Nocardia ninae NBRC 108245]